MTKDRVVTVRVDKKVVDEFDRGIKEVGLKRDTYLQQMLADELGRIEDRPPNSPRALRYIRAQYNASDKERVRVGLRLNPDLADQLTRICAEKRIPRDLFVEIVMNFLANGYEDPDAPMRWRPSPIFKAAQVLYDPHGEGMGHVDIYESALIGDDILDIWKEMDRDLRRWRSVKAADAKKDEGESNE